MPLCKNPSNLAHDFGSLQNCTFSDLNLYFLTNISCILQNHPLAIPLIFSLVAGQLDIWGRKIQGNLAPKKHKNPGHHFGSIGSMLHRALHPPVVGLLSPLHVHSSPWQRPLSTEFLVSAASFACINCKHCTPELKQTVVPTLYHGGKSPNALHGVFLPLLPKYVSWICTECPCPFLNLKMPSYTQISSTKTARGPATNISHSDIPLPHGPLIKGVHIAIAIFGHACAWSSSMDSSTVVCAGVSLLLVGSRLFCLQFLFPIPKNIEASQFNCSFGDYICDYTTNSWCKRQPKILALPHWCSSSGCSNGGTKFRY